MQRLNFPSFNFRFKNSENKIAIFDVIRKKFILLTPEEWVRQHVVRELMENKGYPISLISVEKIVKINGMNKRYDVVVFKPNGTIAILIECKAPSVAITQQTFDQIARYNFQLRADYLYVTNGLNHYFCQMDYEKESYFFLKSLPNYTTFTIE
ncbi:type I restriction enzyme HsdR N-terminal domain-containing protein [Myroides sp. 1354]|uniref:type I restriction enzyme HsdR N-terminal domain-containing protein n=1 Tax=unclassified Myroides TaxID=2642485 RepID=UPI00257501C7|nr:MULTISPECIES: type I restriction enzyme HsdR N-terminal domain-containing protein [unclassified Myroides]MDM1045016.1 type I restriction enzyme HsdR N-terminal domain-containing protein [Myroides sp. R163-1]MDM1055898.1 type I restriction enzyme HsdR N-terminal domain-containing protein [Myroides sp. 1354]MDM1069153.1 type I restriction enzyme HsdR N-terminal domain-containing protein [Myroides sp. 1372]